MTRIKTPSTQYPARPFQRRRPLWIAGGVFLLLLVLTTVCGSLPGYPPQLSTNQPLSNPGQTETAAQHVLATIQAANATGTLCIGGPIQSTPYVAIWKLFGTPTQTPVRSQ